MESRPSNLLRCAGTSNGSPGGTIGDRRCSTGTSKAVAAAAMLNHGTTQGCLLASATLDDQIALTPVWLVDTILQHTSGTCTTLEVATHALVVNSMTLVVNSMTLVSPLVNGWPAMQCSQCRNVSLHAARPAHRVTLADAAYCMVQLQLGPV